ncbi:MAG: caspase family protein, partial [Synechocystis sp.]|nr:caspase family protein [Synechocystis sp.]
MGISGFYLDLALVVGINDYRDGIPALGTAKPDAEAIADILAKDYHYQVHLLTDEQATGEALKLWLDTKLPEAFQNGEKGRLVVYFAGHGIALNGEEGPQGYLIPQDAKLGTVASYLPMQWVEKALSQLPCLHCLVILDCCFAGAFRWSSTRKLVAIEETIHQERFDRFIKDPAWQVITSAAADQFALDNLDLSGDRRSRVGNVNHSPFAAALIDALQGAADIYPLAKPGKPPGDGIITATELYLYLRDAVEIASDAHHQRQTPQIWPLKKHDKGEFIFLPPGHELNLPPAPSLSELEEHNPYRGLKSYEAQDSSLFFGRETLTKTLATFVENHPLTIVLGASGSGKSSLVKAGLINYLGNVAPQQWQMLPPMRPGEFPLQNLTATLTVIQPPQSQHLADSIKDWLTTHPSVKLLLIVDQFEELITLGQDSDQKQEFLAILSNVLNQFPDQFRLVVTLRSDFEPQLRDTPLESLWQGGRFVVPAMGREELRAVIEEPASAKVVYFETLDDRGYLGDQLIDEVAGMPGALPLLSFALSELYLQLARRYLGAQTAGETIERAITWADYDELGGVTKSLTRRADQIYETLTSQDAAYGKTIPHVMLRMVAIAGELARRQVPTAELQYPEPENSRVKQVIQAFLDARLLVSGIDARNQSYIEPAHDALVRGWDRLLKWKQAEEENLLLQRRLTPAVVEWDHISHGYEKGLGDRINQALNRVDTVISPMETLVVKGINFPAYLMQTLRQSSQSNRLQKNKPQAFLWHSNPYLDLLQQTLQTPDNWLNQPEREFVQASVLQKRRNVSWRWRLAIAVMVGLSGLTLAALIGQRNALINQARAARQTAEANLTAGKQLDGFGDSLQAAKILTHPLLNIVKPPNVLVEQVQGTLQKNLFSRQEQWRWQDHLGITRTAVSPDGQWIASVGQEGTVKVRDWSGKTQGEIDTQQGPVMNLAFSPDSQTLAIAEGNGTIRLINLQGETIRTLTGHTDMVKGLGFSPDGQLLASGGVDEQVRIWDLGTGDCLSILDGHQRHVWAVVFSPDGQILASVADDDTLRLWGRDGKPLGKIQANQGELHTVAMGPDGKAIATAGLDGTIKLWDIQGNPIRTMAGHQGRVWEVNFSRDGQTLISSAADGTVRRWRITGEPLEILRSHSGPVRNVSFGSDDQQFVSSGDDATIRFWDLTGNQSLTLTGHQGSVRAIAFGNQQLISGGQDGSLRFWDSQGNSRNTLQNNATPLRAIAINPQDQTLAVAQDRTIYRGDSSGQKFVKWVEADALIRNVQFSHDGQQLLSVSDNGTLSVWNPQGNRLNQWQGDRTRLWQAGFSPDGSKIVSGGQDGIVKLWDLQGQLQTQWVGHLGPVYAVAFSPDGRTVASAGQDGTIRLWNTETKDKTQLFQVYEAEINTLNFSPDGQFLVSGDNQGYVQLWSMPHQQQYAT